MPVRGENDHYHILVVDDEENIRKVLETIFVSRGYRVSSASNGLTALKLLGQGGVDLVVLDLKMDGMDGMELLGRIKDASALLPVVVITGFADVASTAAALKGGASDFLSKPFGAQEIFHSVSRLLELGKVREDHGKVLPYFKFTVNGEFPSLNENINGAIHFLTEAVRQSDLCGPAEVSSVVIALYEALSNAVVHGNRGDASKKVRVRAELDYDAVAFSVSDEGEGFVIEDVGGKDAHAGGGRGIYLMNQFMDEVRFNAQGNEVTLIKRRKGSGGPAEKGKG